MISHLDEEGLECRVYALNVCGQRIAVEPLPEVSRNVVCGLDNVRMARLGSLVYTGRTLDFDSLAFMQPSHSWSPRAPMGRWRGSTERADDFWRFAAAWEKLHRRNHPYFPHILYELEFRYNHRHVDLFDPLMDILLGSGPAASQPA